MKRTIILFQFLVLCGMGMFAQSSAVQKAAKSVFTLTTFNKDGSIHASSHGVFVGADGDAVSAWTPFVGANSAVVVDANGKKMNVKVMLGANELYDICKFKVDGKTTPAPVATTSASTGSKVFLLGYSVGKPQTTAATVKSVETFMNKYNYYIMNVTAPDNTVSCPFVNANGQVIGLLQQSETSADIHAVDVAYPNTFAVENGLSVSDPVLRSTGIRSALPDKQDQAVVTMMLANQQGDSLRYVAYIEDFIEKFPKATEGYTNRATNEANANQFDAAARDMETCIKNATDKAEAHSNYAKLILQKLLYKPNVEYAPWTYDKAMEEAKEAYQIKQEPVYQHQQAQIMFAKGEYQQAYDVFMGLTKTKLKNAELYYEAAQCKTNLKAPKEEIKALLDSAIAACPTPYTNVAGPYFLARGDFYNEEGNYRAAVADYNQYDSLMYGRPISSHFYYVREQCEIKIHQYQQALNDISRAILMTPNEPTYWAERGSLDLRVNRPEDARDCANRCIQLSPDYPDAYIILGLAQIQLKDKAAGLKALQKAKELGDPRAEELIKKYQ